jgi:hypothetical protein
VIVISRARRTEIKPVVERYSRYVVYDYVMKRLEHEWK